MDGNLVKGLSISIKKLVLDAEQYLLRQGSVQNNLWGINLYPDKYGAPDFIEFDSMINIRPR